jgi:SAM-dependent methyltransferase
VRRRTVTGCRTTRQQQGRENALTDKTEYEVARRYWNQPPGDCLEAWGVAAFAGCGLTEILYREYEESRHLRHIVGFDKSKSVLELGSGNGRWILALAPYVGHYEGVDLSPAMIDAAKRRVAERRLTNVTLCLSAVQDYAPTRKFDVIYLSGVSQYLQDTDLVALAVRLKDILKPGGVVVERSTTHRRVRSVAESPDYFSIYRTRQEIISLFQDAGWISSYVRASYRFLSLPRFLQRRVTTNKFARLVGATAPVSFHLLRASAYVCELLFEPTGEALDFSHDLFLFRPAVNDERRV